MLGGTAAACSPWGNVDALPCRLFLGFHLSSRAVGSVGGVQLVSAVDICMDLAQGLGIFTNVLAHEVYGGGSGSESPLEARRSAEEVVEAVVSDRHLERDEEDAGSDGCRTRRSVLCSSVRGVLLEAGVPAGVYGGRHCTVIAMATITAFSPVTRPRPRTSPYDSGSTKFVAHLLRVALQTVLRVALRNVRDAGEQPRTVLQKPHVEHFVAPQPFATQA